MAKVPEGEAVEWYWLVAVLVAKVPGEFLQVGTTYLMVLRASGEDVLRKSPGARLRRDRIYLWSVTHPGAELQGFAAVATQTVREVIEGVESPCLAKAFFLMQHTSFQI